MIILKGAEVSAKIREQVQEMLEGLGGKMPCLAIVRVGENPDDLSYERGAMKKMPPSAWRPGLILFQGI